jgi:hypothetical protein
MKIHAKSSDICIELTLGPDEGDAALGARN